MNPPSNGRIPPTQRGDSHLALLPSAIDVKWRNAYGAAIATFVITLVVSHLRSTPYNGFTLLAQAFLHGHTWINWPGPYIDALGYNGQHYIIEAPLPGVLMMPLVAAFGTAVNQTLLSVLLAAVAVGAAWELCERYGLSTATTAWLCAFLLAGTDLLWCAMLGDVWFIAHVCAVCFTLLALVELAGKRRGWLVALWAACAIESRFVLVLAVPVYAYLLYRGERDVAPSTARTYGGFVAVLAAVAALWVWYNAARWGTWYDIGYSAWYHQDQAGMATGSPFRLMYLPMQVWSFFAQLPAFSVRFPWIVPSLSGVALTWTSPALLLALFARKPAPRAVALWVAVVLIAAPNFVYYVNGFAQFGMRHALDFEPFLFALMALAARERLRWWWCALVAYSAAVGLWGCWYWNAFVRPGN